MVSASGYLAWRSSSRSVAIACSKVEGEALVWALGSLDRTSLLSCLVSERFLTIRQ